MLTLQASLAITQYISDLITEVVIESDINTLTDTCTIQMPKKMGWESFNGKNHPIKRGDKMSIKLGYQPDLIEEFSGYVATIGIKTPLQIVCEDEMWIFKQSPIKKEVFRQVKLKTLIEALVAQAGISIPIECPIDVNLGNYRITRNTIAQELEELKKVYGFYAYFRRINGVNKLYAGWGYPTADREIHRFEFSKNIINESLEYIDAKDVKLKVKATSVLKNNKRIHVEVGDKDGELREVYAYDMQEEDLRKFANSEMERFKITGLRGSITVFGGPSVKATDVVRIKTQTGVEGSYLITKLTKTYGTGGYRQKISLGAKVS